MIKERVGRKDSISYSALVEPIRVVIRDTPDARLLQENGGRLTVSRSWVYNLVTCCGHTSRLSDEVIEKVCHFLYTMPYKYIV